MLAPSEPAMWGSATLAIEVSSTSIKAARATVIAISQGFTRGFQAAFWADCGLDCSMGFAAVPFRAGNGASNSSKKTSPFDACSEAKNKRRYWSTSLGTLGETQSK
jgi:hypothetical protein